MNYEDLYQEFSLLEDRFTNGFKFLKEPIGDPTILLSKYGIDFLEILRDFTKLSQKVSLERKKYKDELDRKIAIFSISERARFEAENKKITEGLLDNLINADEEIFDQKMELNKLEALEDVIEKDLKLIYEVVQMIKKIADIRTQVDVKLGANFEEGE